MDVSIFEGSAIALCLGLVASMWAFLTKLVSSKLKDIHEIIVKLIDRSHREEDSRDVKHHVLCEKIDDLEKTVGGLSERISFLQGRINNR